MVGYTAFPKPFGPEDSPADVVRKTHEFWEHVLTQIPRMIPFAPDWAVDYWGRWVTFALRPSPQ